MQKRPLAVPCEMDGAAFYSYAVFDGFSRRRLWRNPAIFAAILSASAAVCFVMHERRGAVLLGCVLLVIGLGLPGFYLGSYLFTLKKQSRRMKPRVYTVELDGPGVTVIMGEQTETWPWDTVHHVYRLPEQLCVYTTPQQGFLICGDGARAQLNTAWDYLKGALPPEKLSDRRGRKRKEGS